MEIRNPVAPKPVPLVPKEDASGFIFSWLKSHFVETNRHASLLSRSDAYDLYLAHCKAMRYEPTTKAAYGKIFKKAFPNVGAKRLVAPEDKKKQRFYTGVIYAPRQAPPSRPNQQHSTAPPITWVEEIVNTTTVAGVPAVSAHLQQQHHSKRKRDEENETKKEKEKGKETEKLAVSTRAEEDDKKNAGAVVDVVSGMHRPMVDVDKNVTTMVASCAVKTEHDHRHHLHHDHHHHHHRQYEQPQTVVTYAQPPHHHQQQYYQDHHHYQQQHYQQQQWQRPAVVSIGRAGANLESTRKLDYYSRLYIKELWGINPINPATTDVSLLGTGVRSEQSTTLALTSCLLMGSASFLVGHWDVSEEYFHKARYHLGELFDTSDYDIACVLLPLSWWTRLFSRNYEEGLSKQHYYVTLGRQICEQINAFNDETYWNLASMHSILSKKDPSALVAAAKRKAPYRRSWEPVRGLTYSNPDKATSLEVQLMISRLYGVVFPIVTFYQEHGFNHPGWRERKEILKANLGAANELEETLARLIEEDSSCTLMYTMMRCQVCAVRVFILWTMRSSSNQQLYAAQTFVHRLLQVSPSIMVMTTHEFTTNNYLLIRLPVDVLVGKGQTQLLRILYDALMVHGQFYWTRYMCQYIRQRVRALIVHDASSSLSSEAWGDAEGVDFGLPYAPVAMEGEGDEDEDGGGVEAEGGEGEEQSGEELLTLSPLLTTRIPLTSPLTSPPAGGNSLESPLLDSPPPFHLPPGITELCNQL